MALGTRLAGPSRSIAPLLRASSTVFQSRSVISIPHPRTVRPPSTAGSFETHFQIKTQLRIRNTADAFAIVRAAEQALGSSVISVDVTRDPMSYRPFFFIYISTLTPVEFTKPILLDIPFPKLRDATESGDVDPYGGPSLRDVMDVLNSSPTELAPGETGIQFRIEKMVNRPKAPQGAFARKSDNSRGQEQEEEHLLDALEDKGGQWAELAQRWSRLRKSPRSSSPTNLASNGAASITDILQDADQVADTLERGLVREDQRRAKHSRYASRHPKETEQVSEEEDVIGKARQHASSVREELHKTRQAKASTLDSDAAATTDGWTFSLGSDDNGPILDDPKVDPGATSRTAFSLQKMRPKKETEQSSEPAVTEESTAPTAPVTFAPEPPVETSLASGTSEKSGSRTRQHALKLAQMEIEAQQNSARYAQQKKGAKARAAVEADSDTQVEVAAPSTRQPTKAPATAQSPKETPSKDDSGSFLGRFFKK